jgi:hypothetical protein
MPPAQVLTLGEARSGTYRIPSTPGTGGAASRAMAIFRTVLGDMGRPASAAAIVSALTCAALARSMCLHARRAISCRSRSGARATPNWRKS